MIPKAGTLKRLSSYPPDMDPQCVSICDAMNALPGIQTVSSCCGHGERPLWIQFRAETIECLGPLLRGISSNEKWRVGVFWLSIVNRLNPRMHRLYFRLDGPVGGSEDADSIARELAHDQVHIAAG